jgi:glucose-6-phosphate-specific signal transduction histidine kinase
MFTLDSFRRNRNLAFWTLHSLGWIAYGVTQGFGAWLYDKSPGFIALFSIATVSGFVLSAPMRYVFRRLWGRQPRTVLLGVLATTYPVALAWRMLINMTYIHFVDPEWHLKTWFEIFGGALSSMYLLLCWAGLYFGIKYYEWMQEQREAVLKASALAQEAQLKMLRYQLNPHFLFNTLNAISTLILDNENRTANSAVMRLSEFLRYTLDQDPMKKVTLRQEIDALNLYLSTERLRFGARLRLEFAVEEQALEALVPSLILQPLIENAIKYAISPREAGGMIRIEGRVRDRVLELAVVDDGPGLSMEAILGAGRGVGLRNTRERLAVLYGDGHRFATLGAQPGLRIEIGLPYDGAGAA